MLANRPSGDVFRLLPPFPLSTSLLQLYAHDSDRKLLRDFYYVDDRRWESAILELEESLDCEFGEKVEKVRKAGKRFAEDKEYGWESKVSLRAFDYLEDNTDCRLCEEIDDGRTCQITHFTTNARK
jgi:hypothetical protein